MEAANNGHRFRPKTRRPLLHLERVHYLDSTGKAHSLLPSPGARLVLPAGCRNVEIRFTVRPSAPLHPVRFTTRLTRSAGEISAADGDHNVVTFDWLPPGDYHFHIASLEAGRPGDPERVTLEFTVLPSFWQTAWFRLLLGVGLVASSTLAVWRVLHNRHRQAVEKLQERKRAEAALLAEHASRLLAERESHALSQRLLTAHEDERRRLARELHDDVTQRLARLAIDAAQAERGVPPAPDPDRWRKMREQLVRLSGDIHSLAYRLHPSILDELGLVEALRAECSQFARRETIPVKVQAREIPRDLPRETALCLFRIVQESLSNVARHARAQGVQVTLAARNGGLQLSVHDDGVGFHPAQNRRPSLGHASMRERVRLLGGELDIESQPGRGTTLLVRVPFQKGVSP